MPTIVIPYRPAGKTRLEALAGREVLAEAMLRDVEAACRVVARTVVARAGGGQGAAVADALRTIEGPVAVVNADLPCALPGDIRALLEGAPALVRAADGTTNALALLDARHFRALYGPGSASRYIASGLSPINLPNLADDVDSPEDLERLGSRLGPHTSAAVESIQVRA